MQIRTTVLLAWLVALYEGNERPMGPSGYSPVKSLWRVVCGVQIRSTVLLACLLAQYEGTNERPVRSVEETEGLYAGQFCWSE